jgi:hypothetical protein
MPSVDENDPVVPTRAP